MAIRNCADEVNTDSSYYAIKNMWSSDATTRSNKMWRVGCFTAQGRTYQEGL